MRVQIGLGHVLNLIMNICTDSFVQDFIKIIFLYVEKRVSVRILLHWGVRHVDWMLSEES
jgi:hypothetical protein